MLPEFLADAVLLVHAGFAVFVITGGWLALRWRGLIWVHLPASLWGAAIEYGGWLCPLTSLEHQLRRQAGEAAYSGDFVQHYVTSALYPAALTRPIQVVLGTLVVVINAAAYGLIWRRSQRQR
ncbi:MAG: DUF2784 domain-containing protein [Steroidobacteraceae bacterium]